MQPRWKALHEEFIRATGGDCNPSPEKFPAAFDARERAEALLILEYHQRVSALTKSMVL
jgi:hypothetical protein